LNGLAGTRVVELGPSAASAFSAKLLADLGADVVKVEAPGGDPSRRRGPYPGDVEDRERSGSFLAWNTNKRGVELDLYDSAQRGELDALLRHADVVVHSFSQAELEAFDLGYERLSEQRPSLVVCSITPFGLTGPYRNYRAEEITIVNAGGWGWLCPGASSQPELGPLKPFGHQGNFQAGLAGAMTSLAARYRAQHCGRGEHIDLSAQAYVATILEQALPYYTYPGRVASRLGIRALNPWGLFACRDGLIFLATIEPDQWERLVEFMGAPEWTQLELFADFAGRFQNYDALKIFLDEWIAEWTVDELFHKGQQHRICFAPVLTMNDLERQEHLRERGFFHEVQQTAAGPMTMLGAPYRLSDSSWAIQRPAPTLGEHAVAEITADWTRGPDAPPPDSSESALPLAGVRVADFTWVWAGPFGAMQLAHLGAEVIKCESAGRPDLGRRLPVYPPDSEPGLNRSGYFNQWNQGKQSLGLNLGHPDSVAVAKALVAECDVVIENFATGVMDRLGLGYEALREVRPDLIYASISGYGDTGPLSRYMAYGPAISPLSGLSAMTGYSDGSPRELGIALADPVAGVTAAVAICAALNSRQRSGLGQHIDVSLWEATATLAAEGWMDFQMNGRAPQPDGNRDPHMAPHGCFRCAGDDEWITVACASEAEWAALRDFIDPKLADDSRFGSLADRKRNEDALEQIVSSWTQSRQRWTLTEELQALGVAAFPSMTPRDLVEDAQLTARGLMERLDHPEVGARAHAGVPWRLEGARNGVRSPAPVLGAHTRDVLRDVLNYSPARIDQLLAEGVCE
jgi:crotonobetainyl-CoA:carnitine CoA-transferase CaiB-like acyl-CoA transferase